MDGAGKLPRQGPLDRRLHSGSLWLRWGSADRVPAGADVESVAAVGVTAQQQALDDLFDVGSLIWGHLVFQTGIVPAVPVTEEDLAEAIVPGGGVGATPRGQD